MCVAHCIVNCFSFEQSLCSLDKLSYEPRVRQHTAAVEPTVTVQNPCLALMALSFLNDEKIHNKQTREQWQGIKSAMKKNQAGKRPRSNERRKEVILNGAIMEGPS